MKKVLTIVAIAALAATTAFAYPVGGFGGAGGQGGPCYGQGQGKAGFGPGMGRGFHRGGGFQQQNAEPVDEAGAKAKVDAYIAENLKGFEVQATEKLDMPRGTMYRYSVKDTNGNEFLLMVNPWGQVRGPVPASAFKANK
ncbi:MAG: hypothetical protein C0603_07940 [Denitrovibrio sp.]|nr:MAG: hypothetical protein C0603_07940 [Denitrovibrio sp.]